MSGHRSPWTSLALLLALLASCASEENAETGTSAGGATTAGPTTGQGGATCDVEQCDGVDNDCDGQVDEDCTCSNGETQPCYSGEPDTEGVGECVGGTQTCDLSGTWGECVGEVIPGDELCDTFDNDCDEEIDEGFTTVTCGLGICQVTVDECNRGVPQNCVPGTPNPAGETCEGTDDDCDGDVDEGCSCLNNATQSCYTGNPATQNVGECTDGTQTCANGMWGACTGDVTPSPEQCDGLDNDCDMAVDDGNPGGGAACNTGLSGVCAPGTQQCLSAMLECVQNVQPSTDLCNNLDDDCNPSTPDGSGDPNVGDPCDGGDGDLCAEGVTICTNGTISCNDTTGNTLDVCNGMNDDCDAGSPDGSEDPQNGAACDGADSDLCNEGTRSCTGGMLVCSDNTSHTLDICDGLNNDCDAASADGSEDSQVGTSCDGGDSDLCNEGTQSCSGGMLVCSDNTSSTLDICNGQNDDCDSASPDGSEDPQNGSACDGPDGDLCNEGTLSCVSATLICNDNTGNNLDICNGQNDDCDAASPDGSEDSQVGTSCDGADTDLCLEGTRSCTGGMLVCGDNTGNNIEVCNAADDDCNVLTLDGSGESWYGTTCDGGDVDVCKEGTFGCPGGAQFCSDTSGDSNVILDGSFEDGPNSPSWVEFSTNFGTPICDAASCAMGAPNPGGGTGPRTGTYWAWFGGIDANETAWVEQSVVIAPGTASLTFWLEIPSCDPQGVDTFTVRIDNTVVFTATNTDPACNVLGYVKKTINVSAYANGGSHTVRFQGIVSATGIGFTNFFVDDVRLEPCP